MQRKVATEGTRMETDTELRSRLALRAPEGGFYSADELGDASGDDLDALAECYGTRRQRRGVQPGWRMVRYLDLAGLGAILGLALSSVFDATVAVSFAAFLVGGVAGALFLWAMKRRERFEASLGQTSG